jgi:hypothetical protein
MDERSRTTENEDQMQVPAEVHQITTTRRGSKRLGYSGTTSRSLRLSMTLSHSSRTNIAPSADARRWRDLMLHYQSRMGNSECGRKASGRACCRS